MYDNIEKILDTEYLCGVAYKIDKKKYDKVAAGINNPSRFKDTDVVTFSIYADLDCIDSDTSVMSSLIVWPENTIDQYDCFSFIDGAEWDFEDFVHQITDCVIGVDIECNAKIKANLEKDIATKQKYVETLNKIINNNR